MASSRIRWIYYVVCVLGLGLYAWASSVQMNVAALPNGVASEITSFPVAVEGRSAASIEELEFVLRGLGIGNVVTIIPGDGVAVQPTLVPQFSLTHRLSTYASGLLFWLVSLLSFAPRTDRAVVPDFFWATFLYGLAVTTGGVFFPTDSNPAALVHPVLRVFSVVLIPVFFVRLSLEFPSEHPALRERKFLIRALFIVPLAVASWYSITLLRYFRAPTSPLWPELSLLEVLWRLVVLVYFAAGCVLFFRSGRRTEISREKDQVKWILWGICFGITPFIFLWTLPQVLGMGPLISLQYARLAAVACPLAWAVAVVRHQFMDIDVVIRRSLIYGILALFMGLLYFLIGIWLGERIESRAPQTARFISIVAVIVPVLLFHPTRRTIGRWVDRTFFKIQDSYQSAERAFGELLHEGTLSHQQVVNVFHESLNENLRPKRLAVLVRHQNRRFRAGDSSVAEEDLDELRPWFAGSEVAVAAPASTSATEAESAQFPERWRELGYVVAVPLDVARNCRGLVLLGERESERRYLDHDLAFLSDVASQACRALEKFCLIQQVAEEAMARRQLDEMNRLKNELLSRVAHDLRTPLTSIRWSSRNLIDGVAGEASENQREYLEAIYTSASHLTRLVNNLLEISRLESGVTRVEPEPIDLEAIVDRSLVGLRPIARSKGVEFRVDRVGESHRAWGNEDMALEAVNNLVENAIKFSPDDSEIEIELSQSDSWQRLAIRDHGPGILEEEKESIFERFQQSRQKQSSTKQGFGVGLYVVKSFLEAVQGKVWAENHPEGGARFVCLLPTWNPSPENADESQRTDR